MGTLEGTRYVQASMKRFKLRPNTINRRVGVLALITVLVLAACGGEDERAMESEESAPFVTTAAATVAMDGEAEESFVVTEESAADLSSGGGFDVGVIGRDVIIEMRVLVSSDNIQRTVSAIMANASALGGGVAYSNIDYGDPSGDRNNAYAILVVKVPPEGIDRLLAGLDDTGTVHSISQSVQDVTEQLVDLDVRIRNARESVANIRKFMDRAEDLGDLVLLEGELIRRQTELERLDAQQRYLSERVAFSTVTINVVPSGSVDEEDSGTIGEAFGDGWDVFVDVLYWIGFLLAMLAPFLILAALTAFLVVFVMRRRRAGTESAAPAEGTEESA